MLNLSEAAKVSGQPKSAIWRAVNSGRLPAARTFAGDYRIDPAELHRVFPPGAELATDVSPIVSLKRDPTELERAEAASMQEQIERLFEVGRQIRKELDDAATPSSLPDLAGLGRIFALIRPFFLAGWHAFEQFPHD